MTRPVATPAATLICCEPRQRHGAAGLFPKFALSVLQRAGELRKRSTRQRQQFTMGLGVLSKLKDLAAGAMKSVSMQFSSAAGAIADLAASLANRAAAAADLGRILDIIDMVPGVDFDKPELDADYLNTLLVAVQMGELTLAVHYREQTEASVVRLHPIATAEANALTASADRFSSKILLDGESDKPAIQMLMNTEHLAKNYRHVSADTLINALAFPIEHVVQPRLYRLQAADLGVPTAGELRGLGTDGRRAVLRRGMVAEEL